MSRRSRRRVAGTACAWLLVLPFACWAFVRTFDVLEPARLAVFALAITPFAAAASLVALLIVLLLRRWLPAAVMLVSCAVLVGAVIGRVTGSPEPAPPGAARLNVLVLNTNDGLADTRQLMALVKRYEIDVMVLLETKTIMERLVRAGIKRRLPYIRTVDSRAGGSALLSAHRFQVRPRPQTGPLPPPPSVRIQLGGRPLEVTAAHPPHPSSSAWRREWIDTMRSLPAPAGPVPQVVLADLNATLDNAPFRGILKRGYRDAANVTGDGLRMTFPAPFYVAAIDHVLVGDGIAVTGFATPPITGSDHTAVVAKLALAR